MKMAKLEKSGWIEWEFDEKDAEELRAIFRHGIPVFIQLTEFDAGNPRRSKRNYVYFDGVDMIGDDYEPSKTNELKRNNEEGEEDGEIPPNSFVFTLPVDNLDGERLIELKCSNEEHLAAGNSLHFRDLDPPIWFIGNDPDNEVFLKNRAKK